LLITLACEDSAVPAADLSRLTAIVGSCSQPKHVERLVRSVRQHYPTIRLLVADDGSQPRLVEGADRVRVAADAGIAAGRNAALARVRTPMFLLLEESMELSRRSGVERLLAAIEQKQLDVAAGECVACRRRFGLFTSRRPDPGHATLEFANDSIQIRPGHRAGAGDFLRCDLTHDFFVARTDRVRALGGWDEHPAVDARVEFFVRAQRHSLRVGVHPGSIALRWDAPAGVPTGAVAGPARQAA
jgi:hypothetical protein